MKTNSCDGTDDKDLERDRIYKVIIKVAVWNWCWRTSVATMNLRPSDVFVEVPVQQNGGGGGATTVVLVVQKQQGR